MTSAYFSGWDYTINKQEKTAWQLVNRKADFFYKTNRFESIRITHRIESIRIANWNALVVARSSSGGVSITLCILPGLWMTYLHTMAKNRPRRVHGDAKRHVRKVTQQGAAGWLLLTRGIQLSVLVCSDERKSESCIANIWTVRTFAGSITVIHKQNL